MYGYIYKTVNNINGKIYIGQHHGEFTESYKGSGVILKKAVLKYGKDNFRVVFIDTAESQIELDEKEKLWIRTLKSNIPCIGYNLTYGGQFGFFTGCKHNLKTCEHLSKQWYDKHRRHHTQEEKDKIRAGNKNKYVPPEVGRKISESNKGREFTDEHRHNLSISHTGLKQSQETIQKRIKSHEKKVICEETGMIFDSVKSACEYVGGDIVYSLRNGTAYKKEFHFIYYKEDK